jgi:hypothetical protein
MASPAAGPLTATDQVFLVPELLESILLHLPLQDLLVNAQRINHTWNAIIQNSKRLQEVLFFEATSLKHIGKTPEFNPLLVQAFPPWFSISSSGNGWANWNWRKYSESLDANSSEAKKEAYGRKEASWRRMLPIQPASRKLKVVMHSYSWVEEEGNTEVVECGEGVRMGSLFNFAGRVEEKDLVSFSMKWDLKVENRTTPSESGDDEDGKEEGSGAEKGKDVFWSMNCVVGMAIGLAVEFKSQE